MRRGPLAVAVSASLMFGAACSSGSPESTPSSKAHTVLPTELAGQAATDLHALEASFENRIIDPTRKQITEKLLKGICAVIGNIKSGEVSVIPNPEMLVVQGPDNSGYVVELAGILAQENRTVFGPPIAVNSPQDILTGNGGLNNLSLSEAMEFRPPVNGSIEDRTITRQQAGTFRDSQDNQSSATVRINTNIQGLSLDEFTESSVVGIACEMPGKGA